MPSIGVTSRFLLCLASTWCATLASAQITRDFFAFDMNKASHYRGQQSPWPDDCCKGEATPIHFGVWRSLGAQVNWNQIALPCEPRNGADPNDRCYMWDKIDGYLRQATAHHEEIIYVVFDTPDFANRAAGSNFPPSDVDGGDKYLKDFVTALYRHATANKWHIKYWECWNEPDVHNEYGGTLEQLMHMCRDIRDTIRPLDPTAQFISPAFTSTDILGFRQPIDPKTCSGRGCSGMFDYLTMGGGQYADIVGYHGYAFPDPVDPLFDTKLPSESLRVNVPALTSAVQTIVARTGNQGKPLWMTEGGDDLPPTSQEALRNDDRHAAFLARYYLQFMGRGTSLVSWYGWDFSGPIALLADHSGIPNDRLNKGGHAYRQIYNWTVERGATMTVPCTPEGTTYTCTLTDSKGRTMLAMYDTSQDCTGEPVVCGTLAKAVPAQYKKWTDLEGKVHDITGKTVPVGRKPILLETAAELTQRK
ncbi:MAG TPA: hypothetical protein VKR57_02780 [Terriglobales bacterium]|nr:hypothetical protein [Terriglobales bacterium]